MPIIHFCACTELQLCNVILSFQTPPPNKSLLEVMARVYVGNLDYRVTKRDLEDEFRVFGVIRR